MSGVVGWMSGWSGGCPRFFLRYFRSQARRFSAVSSTPCRVDTARSIERTATMIISSGMQFFSISVIMSAIGVGVFWPMLIQHPGHFRAFLEARIDRYSVRLAMSNEIVASLDLGADPEIFERVIGRAGVGNDL